MINGSHREIFQMISNNFFKSSMKVTHYFRWIGLEWHFPNWRATPVFWTRGGGRCPSPVRSWSRGVTPASYTARRTVPVTTWTTPPWGPLTPASEGWWTTLTKTVCCCLLLLVYFVNAPPPPPRQRRIMAKSYEDGFYVVVCCCGVFFWWCPLTPANERWWTNNSLPKLENSLYYDITKDGSTNDKLASKGLWINNLPDQSYKWQFTNDHKKLSKTQ